MGGFISSKPSVPAPPPPPEVATADRDEEARKAAEEQRRLAAASIGRRKLSHPTLTTGVDSESLF